jgi:uncharacterized protein
VNRLPQTKIDVSRFFDAIPGTTMTDPLPIDPQPDAPLPASIDPRLLEVLVCPLTKAPLEYDRAANELISRKAGLAYPIRDGIPIMLPEEARILPE